uniref:SUEL-type lectin domain-containing protein n=1 Tax=Quercus lobata TaxID=97700 RepID=A0A7N2LV32_QUELO
MFRYHIPRTWVHLGENLLVLHEELGGDPSKFSLLTRTGQEICAHVSEADPPRVDSWKPNQVFNSQIPEVRLNCEQGWHFNMINFASFGTPRGNCGTFSPGICHVNVTSIVQQACIGQERCAIPISTTKFDDPCPQVLRSLAIEALCSA